MTHQTSVFLCLVLLLVTSAQANVIFPAFTAPYVAQMFFPVVLLSVLIVEATIYKWRCQNLSIRTLLFLVVAVNIVSWLAGLLITRFLFPSGLVKSSEGMLAPGPDFTLFELLGFFIAYVLSVLIEGGCLKAASLMWSVQAPFTLALLANTASYIALSVLVWLFVR